MWKQIKKNGENMSVVSKILQMRTKGKEKKILDFLAKQTKEIKPEDAKRILLLSSAYCCGRIKVPLENCFVNSILVQELSIPNKAGNHKYITIDKPSYEFLHDFFYSNGNVNVALRSNRVGAIEETENIENSFIDSYSGRSIYQNVGYVQNVRGLITCFSFATFSALKPYLGEAGEKNLEELVSALMHDRYNKQEKDGIDPIIKPDAEAQIVKKVLSDICNLKFNFAPKKYNPVNTTPSAGETLFQPLSEKSILTFVDGGYISIDQAQEMSIELKNKKNIRNPDYYTRRKSIDPRYCFINEIKYDEVNGITIFPLEASKASFVDYCKQADISNNCITSFNQFISSFNFATPLAIKPFVEQDGDKNLNDLFQSFIFSRLEKGIDMPQKEEMNKCINTIYEICHGKEYLVPSEDSLQQSIPTEILDPSSEEQ